MNSNDGAAAQGLHNIRKASASRKTNTISSHKESLAMSVQTSINDRPQHEFNGRAASYQNRLGSHETEATINFNS